MTTALLITFDGEICECKYDDNTTVDGLIRNKGVGKIKVLEIYESGNRQYMIYGYKRGTVFNRFDFHHTYPMNDVIVVCCDINGDVIDFDKDEFLNDYCNVDVLDDYLLEDELESSDEYDFSDSFIDNDDGDSWLERILDTDNIFGF